MLEALRTIGQDVAAAPDVKQALDVIVRGVRDAMGVQVCSVYLLDKATDRYVFMATEGLNKEQQGRLSLGKDEGLVSLVARRAEPINLENATLHPRFHYVPEIGEEPYLAFLGVPVIHHRQVLGVLVVQQTDVRRFQVEEESFLITLSAQLAGLIAHALATGALHPAEGSSGEVREDAAFRGVPGAPGIGIGVAVLMAPHADLDAVPDRNCDDVTVELLTFDRAINKVRDDIRLVSAKLSDSLPKEEIALFDAYLHMLDDGALAGEVNARIREGQWAQGALRGVITAHVRNFEQMENSYLRERAADVRELGQRVLAYLQDVQTKHEHFPEKMVLVGHDVSAAMLGEVPAERVVGIVSTQGSGSSHASILSRSLGIPAVMGCVDLPLTDVANRELVVDGFYGDVHVRPSDRLREHYYGLILEEEQLVEELKEHVDEPATTPDGHRVLLWANVGLAAEVPRSLEYGAEGVGLFRTEIPFISSDRFPTEEEQRVLYREHLEAFAPRPVTMRTLDIGGDKALSYFPIREGNPFLGWRGVRVTLDHPEILVAQVRAMIKASEGIDTTLRIMLPMITNIAEVDEAVGWIRRCYDELIEEGHDVALPQIGVMVEVPAAVYQIREIAERVDFVAVGSNDLTQYLLAVDRNNVRVADLFQELHPAVLGALQRVAAQTHAVGKPVGICGELAGTPAGAVLLMAMGFDTLSMNATNLLRVKYVVRNTPLVQAQRLLKQVMLMESAEAVGQYMHQALVSTGLGRLVGPDRI